MAMHAVAHVAAAVHTIGLILLCSVYVSSGRRVLTGTNQFSKAESSRHTSSGAHASVVGEHSREPGLLRALATFLFSMDAPMPARRGNFVGRSRGHIVGVRPGVNGRARSGRVHLHARGTQSDPDLQDRGNSRARFQLNTSLVGDVLSQPVVEELPSNGSESADNPPHDKAIDGVSERVYVQSIVEDLKADIPSLNQSDLDGLARDILEQTNIKRALQQRNGLIGQFDAKSAGFENTLTSLTSDIGTLFQQLPDWSNFESDFRTIDQHDNILEGVTQNTLLLKLLKQIKRKLVVSDDVQVRFLLDGERIGKDTGPFLSAQWNVQLGGSELPFLKFWQTKNLVDIEVEAVFHLNNRSKVDYVRVNKWLVNGRHQAWPEIDLSYRSRPFTLKKIKKWVEDLLPDLRPWWTEHAGYLSSIEEIGSGNFAKVYSMDLTCPPSQRFNRIAMKELLPDMMDQDLIKGEIAAMKDLSEFLLMDEARRKNIIGVADDYSPYCAPLLAKPRVQDGRMYLPMPFANKGTYNDIYSNPLRRKQYGGDEGMYGMLLHIAKGVKALNGAGYVHNDLHGENALVTCTSDEIDPKHCYASLVDLGLATRVDSMTAGIRGKAKIIPPEMVRLRNEMHYPMVKSDVWSLGTILWEIALGPETLPTINASAETIESIVSELDFRNESFPALDGQPEIQTLLRGMLTRCCFKRWDIDKVIEHLERVAHPGMKGNHSSPFQNAGVIPGGLVPWDREPKIAPGALVEIIGMQKATYLNGCVAEVLKREDGINGYEIRLEEGNAVVVRSQNLRLVQAS